MAEPAARLRAGAARAVDAVVRHGRSLDAALADARAGVASAEDRGLLQALAYGVLRDHRLLAVLAQAMLRRPLKAEQGELHALLLVGLYQLRSTRVAAHAAVAETVAATAALQSPWARGLVNALLRRYQREAAALEARVSRAPGVRYSHPDWLVEAVRRDWGEACETVLAANNQPGPMTLRVNLARGGRADYLQALKTAGLAARSGMHAPCALTLERPCAVQALPGFAEGRVSVQDEAAQLAAGLLAPAPGARVLDACAAPGGKTAHLLERCPGARLTALDVDEQRLEKVQANLQRLSLQARLQVGDAADTAAWWDGEAFDAILLDAPCSGTGVIRRHPDIKWLRRRKDIAALAARQRRLLGALWGVLAPQGRLLYATCSALCAENEAVVGAFLRSRGDAREVPIEASWGEPRPHGRRIRAGDDGMDGFYYALLEKPAIARS